MNVPPHIIFNEDCYFKGYETAMINRKVSTTLKKLVFFMAFIIHYKN